MKLKYISWIPAIIIMGIIFYFSSKEAEVSDDSSLTIADKILTVYETISEAPFLDETREIKLDHINLIVRKMAHFIEYAVLAIAIAFHLWVWKKDGMILFILTIGLSAGYATTDEFHQRYISGRSGQIADILLDTAGAIAGFLLFLFILKVLNSRKRLKNNSKALSS